MKRVTRDKAVEKKDWVHSLESVVFTFIVGCLTGGVFHFFDFAL